MPVATPTEVRQLALCLESVRGTVPAAPSRFLSLTKDSNLDYTTKLLADPALRGYNAQFASFAGAQGAKGNIKTPVRASSIGEFLKMLFGAPTAGVEQSSFTVTLNVNDTLDMTEDGGSEFHITLTPGTYIAGQTDADAGSLCALLKTLIEAGNGASTYTVAYSRTTNKFTLTKNTGVFVIKFATGVNTAKNAAALLGFTVADTASAIAATSDSVTAAPPFKHSFTQGQTTKLPSYSFYINRGLSTKQYNLGQVEKIKFSCKDDAPVEMDATVLAQKEAAYGGAWSPAYRESPVLMFSGNTVKVVDNAPAVPNIVEWSLDLEPGVVPYRPFAQTQYPNDFLARGPFMASGDMTVYFMDEVERAKFIADTLTSLEFICAGTPVVAGVAVNYTLELSFPNVEYSAFPFQDVNGFLGAKVKWAAKGATSAGAFVPLATAYLINAVPPGF